MKIDNNTFRKIVKQASEPDSGFIMLLDPQESYSAIVKYDSERDWIEGDRGYVAICLNEMHDIEVHNGHYRFTSSTGSEHHLYVMSSVTIKA